MENPEAVSQRPHYQKCGHTPCNRDEDTRWFVVNVKIHGKTLTITVCPDEFQNSPTRLDEFNQYLEMLQLDSEGEWPSDEEEEDDDDDMHRGGESPAQHPMLDLSLDGCYEWAVRPFLPSLEEIAPRPSDGATITLQHFFSGESFDASLNAVDDTLVPGDILARDEMENVVGNAGILWKTTCPIFATAEVEVLSDDPTYILVDEPSRVRVQGKQLFFKAFQDPDDSIGAHEVLTLEKIFKARFNQQEVRTSRLYGIVEDDKSQVIGLLLHYIQVDDTLHDKVIDLGSSGSDLKDKWKRQVTGTVEALHKAGIVWGDVKASNVLVDTAGDAWVTDFGGGHTEGWVDRDKAGTIEGDLQGLRAIREFVDTGRDPEIMD
ncbi:hypothetical protein INS49_004550 [Diaporthe citri]|uniref:uncharacterized protein n=1 Tax=Diaporthe citri TaxID=83186 RepID=UPI001C8154EF|nr:uncharacterized protein INS49_004550 [Diaporthe citri]KAG6354533.1 hypothetical protein INS49_004550 [Diaporthe citri]